MTNHSKWPSRQEWEAGAEHHARTICYASERVPSDPGHWLTPTELAELRERADAVVREVRSTLRGRNVPDVRSDRTTINHAHQRITTTRTDVGGVLKAAADLSRTAARRIDGQSLDLLRFDHLIRTMSERHSAAAAAAEWEAVRREIARRTSDEGWQAELDRRRRIDTRTTVFVHHAPRPAGAEPQVTQVAHTGDLEAQDRPRPPGHRRRDRPQPADGEPRSPT
jgi:hypothetical protein